VTPAHDTARDGAVAVILAGGVGTPVGLAAIDDEDATVPFHDAVDTAIASADTITGVNGENCISAVPRRGSLRCGQTPQAFRRGTLSRACAAAAEDPASEATDDRSVVLNYLPEVPSMVLDGSDANIKITQPVGIQQRDDVRAAPEHARAESGRAICIDPIRTATPMRTVAFGAEDAATQPRGDHVAYGCAQVLASPGSGHTFDIRLPETDHAPTLLGARP